MLKSLRHICFSLALTLIFVSTGNATEYIKSYIPNSERVGEGRLSYLFWDVYDARLWAPNGNWSPEKPYALQLSYLRKLEGEKIADSSVEEMRKQGVKDEVKLAGWHSQMNKIFPDVKEGTTLSGVLTDDGVTIFFRNGEEIGRIKDPEFGQAFFNIWLSDKTSAPKLREQLLSQVQQ